jgi:hypothetical protein
MHENRMQFGLRTLSLLLTVLLMAGMAWGTTFTAALDRDTLTLGESATLTLRFDGETPRNLPVLPNISGLAFGNPAQNSINMNINGVPSSILTLSYAVTPQRAGEFTIPPIAVDVNGQQLSTAPLKLVASKASAPSTAAINSGNEVAFMKLNFPKQKVYAGECLVAQLELYLRDDVSGLNGFQMNNSPTDGFSAGKLVELQNQRRRVQVGNRVYTEIPLAIPLTVVKTGTLALGPFTASAVVILPSQNQGGDPFMRQFFNQGEQRQIPLATEALSVESLPLPEQNRPASFAGAVGQFELAATAGPSTVTVGDPVTVRVQISGRGSIESLTLPDQDAWKNFKTYPPTTKLETSDQFGFQGTKTFEQIISPLNSDVHEIPALMFSFFNPEDGQYHTLTQPATPLTVKAAGATPLPPVAANKSANEEKPVQDIVSIKDRLGELTASQAPLVTKSVFLAVQTVPVLAFLAAFVWRKRADNLANNPRLRRQRAVATLIASGKADLKKFAAENKSEEFFAALFRLLQEQLGERLDCPASAITEDVVDSHALLRGAPATLRTALHEQFQLCNQARYAPVRGTSELNSVAAQFEKLLGELQNLKS